MRTLIFKIGFLCCAIFIAACTTPPIRGYSGNVVSRDDLAILAVRAHGLGFGVQPQIYRVDDTVVEHPLMWTGNLEIELKPGAHVASVGFTQVNLVGTAVTPHDPKFISFEAEAGHTYEVHISGTGATTGMNLSRTVNWDAQIVDTKTGKSYGPDVH